MKISVCGKGGSGKSTVVSLLANQAVARRIGVVVIDSDESNSGLFRMLGFQRSPVPLMDLIGGRRELTEKMRKTDILAQSRISVDDIPSRHVLTRNGMRLVSIGKILQSLEGCACPMGVLSREFLRKLVLDNNQLAIVDMEAGVEHFGRGIDNSIDTVLLVVEPSMESIDVAEKIHGLALKIRKRLLAVLNKVSSDKVAAKLKKELKGRDIDVIGTIKDDSFIFEACLEGHPLDRGEGFDAAGRILEYVISKH
jgi:CO dehydrogenase maturation factor